MWQLEGGRKREAITLAVVASTIAREDGERKCQLREGREKREKEIGGEIEDSIFGIFTLLDQTSAYYHGYGLYLSQTSGVPSAFFPQYK